MKGHRMARAWSVVALTLCLCLPAAARAQQAPPPVVPREPARPAVFSDKTFAEAVAASKGTGKVTIVKATAEWCGPCKAMNRTTMVDPAVVAWFGEPAKGQGNGIIIEFDVDKDNKLAQDLNIRAMPTTIAFIDGKEFDRIVGYRDAKGFLSWLESVKAGRGTGDGLSVKVEKSGKDGKPASIRERVQNLRNAILSGVDPDKATAEALWLWNNMVAEDPAMAGVRGVYFATDLKNLVKRYAPAAEAFAKVRDEAWAAYASDPGAFGALDDWLVLNDVLNQNDRTLEWFDRTKGEPDAARVFERVDYRLEHVLVSNRRLADVCLLYRNPIEKLRQDAKIRSAAPRVADEEQNRQARQIQDRIFRDNTSMLYASLLLAGRESDAQSFAVQAIRLDDTGAMRIALVRAAVDNRVGRPEQWEMLDAASRSGESVATLREELERQAGKP